MIKFINNFSPELRRKYLLNNTNLAKEVKNYLSAPLINKNTLIKDIEFLVLDFETTGLNANKDKIVSMGYTVIKDLHILLQYNSHFLVKPKSLLNEKSVTIHCLTDDEVEAGISISAMMQNLLKIMKSKVVIVHFDKIEKNFINKVCSQLYGFENLPIIIVDTLRIESKKRLLVQNSLSISSFRLFTLREKYNLPRYKAHNAMQDAIATAELFLAQIAYMGKISELKLKDVY